MDHILSEQYPRLLLFAKNTRASIQRYVAGRWIGKSIHLPLSQDAFEELEALQQQLTPLQPAQWEDDVWNYVWGNGSYSSKRIYKLAFSNAESHLVFRWIWKASCIPRIKYFSWLILVDRLNTKDMLQRRHCNVQDDDRYVLCPLGVTEDL